MQPLHSEIRKFEWIFFLDFWLKGHANEELVKTVKNPCNTLTHVMPLVSFCTP